MIDELIRFKVPGFMEMKSCGIDGGSAFFKMFYLSESGKCQLHPEAKALVSSRAWGQMHAAGRVAGYFSLNEPHE